MSAPSDDGELPDAEFLHRQVNPNFYKRGRLSSLAFRPFDAPFELSVTRARFATAEQAFRIHTDYYQRPSVGTWTVSALEARELNLVPRSQPEPPINPGHAVIDFSSHGSNQRQARAKKLRDFAESRGPGYCPD